MTLLHGTCGESGHSKGQYPEFGRISIGNRNRSVPTRRLGSAILADYEMRFNCSMSVPGAAPPFPPKNRFRCLCSRTAEMMRDRRFLWHREQLPLA